MADDGSGAGRILDQGYRPFTGARRSAARVPWVIALEELRQAWKEKHFRRVAWAALLPLLFFGVLVFLKRFMPMVGFGGDEGVRLFRVQQFWSVFVVFYVGRNAIGEELRTGALELIFSRPVSFSRYLAGKWLALVLAVVGIIVVPVCLLGIFDLLWTPGSDLTRFARLLVSALSAGVLVGLAQGSLMLAISALAGRGTAAGVVWVLLYLVLGGVAEGVSHATGSVQALAFSLNGAGGGLFSNLMGVSIFQAGVPACLAGLVGYSALGAGLTLLRLRRYRKGAA